MTAPLSTRRWLALFLFVWAVSAIPLAGPPVAPLFDWPNHLARAHVLANLDRDAFLGAHYRSAWALMPNLGSDLVLAGLLVFLPTILAGRVFLVLALGAFAFGGAFLARAWSGRWRRSSLLGFVFFFAFPLQMGFVNYVLGIALALVAIGVHLRRREAGIGAYLTPMLPLAVVTAIAHLMAFGELILTLLVLEAAFAWRRERSPLSVLGLALKLGPLLASGSAVYAMGATRGTFEAAAYIPLPVRLRLIGFLFYQGSNVGDVLFGIGLLLLVGGAWAAGWRLSSAGRLLGAIYLLLMLILPNGLGAASYIVGRHLYILPPLLIALGGFEAVARVPMRWVAAAAAILGGGRLANHAAVLFHRSRDLEMLRSDLALLPAGAHVYRVVTDLYRDFNPYFWHPALPASLPVQLLNRDVFDGTLYMSEGQQPLTWRRGNGLSFAVVEQGETDFPARTVAGLQELRRKELSSAERDVPTYLFATMFPGRGRARPGFPIVVRRDRYVIYRLPPVGSSR